MAEKRLIDAIKLLVDLCKETCGEFPDTGICKNCWEAKVIENAPTVDAVEVVRCKDCKWYRPPFCLLNDNKQGYLNHVLPEHFCAYGERDR